MGEQHEPGPGVRLIQARAGMRKAVLDILVAEASGFAGEGAMFADATETDRLWAAQADAARALVLAEDAWADHQRALRERHGVQS